MLEIAQAHPDARKDVTDFMQHAFPRAKWDRAGWEALLSGRWGGPNDSFAMTVRDQGRLVGVLGLVTAHRETALGRMTTANMTSWYVDKSYRGQGVGGRMLDLVTADPQITITNFSSARAAVPVVERAGFVPLDTERCVWRPSGGPTLPVHRVGPKTKGLSPRDARVIADHAGLNLKPVLVETPDGPCTLILSVKQKHDEYVTHEVMYPGNRLLFAAHAREIADSLLPSGGAVLSVDRRFVLPSAKPDGIEAIPVPRFYTPGRAPPEEIDHMYSEIVLLDMKMY